MKQINELREKNYNADNELNKKKPEKSEFGVDASFSALNFNEAGIESEMNLLPSNKEKKCCWNCLKVILKEKSIDKHFDEKIIKLKVVKN